jgi:hypothetical protein
MFWLSTLAIEDRITVKRRTEQGTHVMVANQQLGDFVSISALERGYDSRDAQPLLDMVNMLVAKAVVTMDDYREHMEDSVGGAGKTVFYIDLGSLYLGAESELEITVHLSGAAGLDADGQPVTATELYCYAVSNIRTPDRMHVYDASHDYEAMHSQVDSVFLVPKNPAHHMLSWGPQKIYDLTVQITDSEGQWLTDTRGLFSATNIFEMVESRPSTQAFTLFRRQDAIPAQIYCKVMGEDAPKTRLVFRKVRFDQSVLSRNTAAELTKLRVRVEELERRDSETAKALRHAGELSKSSDLAVVESQVKASEARDAK